MNKRKGSTKRKSNLLLIGGLGLGAYFLLNSKIANAEEMPPAGIGSGYGGGAVLGTSGSPTTSAPVSSTGTQPIYNISFEAPVLESAKYPDSNLTKKDTTVAQTTTATTNPVVGQKSSIKVGSYSGTSTVLSNDGNKLLDFGENAQAVTLTKKQVASSGAPQVALAPVGNTVSDVIKAGNVASIVAQSVRNDPRLATPPPAPPKKATSTPVNTGWGNPIGMISSWFGWR